MFETIIPLVKATSVGTEGNFAMKAAAAFSQQALHLQKLLTTAIAMLVGSGGPPREAAVILDEGGVDVWAQSSLQRQQVLDSLFAKRLQRDKRESSQNNNKQQTDAV